jgi:hypothetical protein
MKLMTHRFKKYTIYLLPYLWANILCIKHVDVAVIHYTCSEVPGVNLAQAINITSVNFHGFHYSL